MHNHPDQRMRWYGDRLVTLTEVYPRGGPVAVSAQLGDSPEDVAWAARYFGIEDTKKHPANVYGLTEKEQRVLRACAAGCPAKDAAKALGLSVNTVNQHISVIYRKMGVHTMVAATLKAERAGLLGGVVPVTVQRWVTAQHTPAPQAKTQTPEGSEQP